MFYVFFSVLTEWISHFRSLVGPVLRRLRGRSRAVSYGKTPVEGNYYPEECKRLAGSFEHHFAKEKLRLFHIY